MLIQMWAVDGEYREAKYGTFSVGPESQDYQLTVGDFSSPPAARVGDDLASANGYKFWTRGRPYTPAMKRGDTGGW